MTDFLQRDKDLHLNYGIIANSDVISVDNLGISIEITIFFYLKI